MQTKQKINCANCWGVQSYDGRVYDIELDHNKEVISHRKRDGFIRRFVSRFIDGIRLKRIKVE